jgi:WD40 repeat protein
MADIIGGVQGGKEWLMVALMDAPGVVDWGGVVCAFLPKEDRDRFSLICRLAREIFRNALPDYYRRFLHVPTVPLPKSLTQSVWLTKVRRGNAAASSGQRPRCLDTFHYGVGGVLCLKMNQDGSKLFTGSYDPKIWVRDLMTGEMRSLTGHTDAVYCLQMGLGQLFSGSADMTIKVWDLKTHTCLHTILTRGEVLCLQLSPDGTKLFSGSSDHTIQIWDLGTYTEEDAKIVGWASAKAVDKSLGRASSIQSPDRPSDLSTAFALAQQPIFASSSVYTCLHTLVGHTNTILCLQVSPDGTALFSGSADTTIRVWDLVSGVCINTFMGHKS